MLGEVEVFGFGDVAEFGAVFVVVLVELGCRAEAGALGDERDGEEERSEDVLGYASRCRGVTLRAHACEHRAIRYIFYAGHLLGEVFTRV